MEMEAVAKLSDAVNRAWHRVLHPGATADQVQNDELDKAHEMVSFTASGWKELLAGDYRISDLHKYNEHLYDYDKHDYYVNPITDAYASTRIQDIENIIKNFNAMGGYSSANSSANATGGYSSTTGSIATTGYIPDEDTGTPDGAHESQDSHGLIEPWWLTDS